MAKYAGKCGLALIGLFLITGQASAGEEIIWEYRNDAPTYLDPADYPDDALHKVFKMRREALEFIWNHPSGSVFRDCPDCPEMVIIPVGSFRMGDLNGDGESDEKPVHTVTIPKAFAVGKYEVTQGQWKAVMGNNPSKFKGDDRPVEKVSWNDAKDFIRKLNSSTGKKYRLLTESEWEYATRAGTTTKYPWGNGIGLFSANCDGCGSRWDNKKTAPVYSFKPNAFGLYDMNGNVWEWVEDCYKDSYNDAPSDGSSIAGANSCRRVNRGGSWSNYSRYLRSAVRGGAPPGIRGGTLGFRLARTL